MWAYKLEASRNPYGMTATVQNMRRMLRREVPDNIGRDVPADTITLFERDLTIAKNIARSLGWDLTSSGIECYLTPGPQSFMYGFIITQATGGQRYIISPVPLDYMKEHIDWNAHTSSEEMSKTINALNGKIEPPPPLQMSDWKLSRNNNQYCHINGAQVTIFAARDGGFKAVIGNDTTGLKVFTNAFQTEQACADYVVSHFYDLIKHWGNNDAEPDDPFEGVDWGDDAETAGEHQSGTIDDNIPF